MRLTLPPLRRRLGLVLRASVTIVLIGFVVARSDVDQLAERVSDLNIGWVTGALLLLFVQAFVAAARGAYVLANIGSPVTLLTVIRIFFVGQFFSQTLPSSIGGDVVRVWMFHKVGLRLHRAINGVLIDRVTALVSTLLFVTLSSGILFGIVTDDAVRAGIVLILLAGFGAVVFLLIVDYLPWPPAHWRAVAIAHALSADARRLLLRPQRAAIVIGFSLCILCLTALVVYLLSLALGLRIGALEILVLMPLVLLATLVPVSLGGWGVREVAMVAAFAFAGVAATNALVLSILFGLGLMLIGLPGGVLWLTSSTKVSAQDASRVSGQNIAPAAEER